MILIYLLLITIVSCQNVNFTMSLCGPSTNFKKRRPRIAFISHDSAIATFFHNPEQGSRDAANIVDVDIEWNRYLTTTEARMSQDIIHAVDNHIDGIICSIPNLQVYKSIQYAISKNVPVIVFNSGLEYAKTLGLTRVMQDDFEAGLLIGQHILKGNFTKPLAVQFSSMEKESSTQRLNGFQQAMSRKEMDVLKITDNVTNSTFTPAQLIADTFRNGKYDSIVSLGGSVSSSSFSLFAITHIHLDMRRYGRNSNVRY